MKQIVVLFGNSDFSNSEKCLAWREGQWGFVTRGPVNRCLLSTIYGWTKNFTPIYFGAKAGDEIKVDNKSIRILHDQPECPKYFGDPTRVLI